MNEVGAMRVLLKKERSGEAHYNAKTTFEKTGEFHHSCVFLCERAEASSFL
jgi:hypothetical protein